MRLVMRTCALSVVAVLASAVLGAAQDYKVAKLESGPPAGSLAPEVAALLAPSGYVVLQGERPMCEIWICKEWLIAADAKTSGEIQYPLTPGQVFGAIRFPRKSSDFRD